MKKHFDDSDEDIPLPNQPIHRISQNLVETSTRILNNRNTSERRNLPERTEVNCKRARFEQDSYNSQKRVAFDADESVEKPDFDISLPSYLSDPQNNNESIEGQDVEDLFFSYTSDSQSSNVSDEEDATSDLSDMTDVDANECVKYNDLFAGMLTDAGDIYQEFPSEEYMEFMHIIIRFRVQDPLANTFIRFFNKYLNRDDRPLSPTSQTGRAFIENLKLPNFGWRKEVIFEYKGLEYVLEFRTILDGIRQILTNKSIANEFTFEYKLSIDDVNTIKRKFILTTNINFFFFDFTIKGIWSASVLGYVRFQLVEKCRSKSSNWSTCYTNNPVCRCYPLRSFRQNIATSSIHDDRKHSFGSPQ